MRRTHPVTLGRYDIYAIAGASRTDPDAVRRCYAGARVRPATLVVVAAAAAKLQLPLPPGAEQPASDGAA